MNSSPEMLAGEGLRYVFWGVIAILVGTVVAIIIPLVGLIVMLVGMGCEVYGYLTAAKSDTGYMNAVFCVAGGIVVSLLNGVAGEGVFGSLLSILSSILGLAVVYFMCQTTGKLLSPGRPDLAVRADSLWKLYLGCTVVQVICAVLSIIPLIGLLAGVLSVLTGIVQLVAEVLYMIFLYKAQKALRGEA